MASDREDAKKKVAAAAWSDAAGLVGFYAFASGLGEGTAILGGLVVISQETALGATVMIIGGISGGLALAAAPAIITVGAIAWLADESHMAAVNSGADAFTYVSPGTLALTPFSPLFSPAGQPLLGTTTIGPLLDFGTGVGSAGSLMEIGATSFGFGVSAAQPDYQRGANDLLNYWSPTPRAPNGASPNPAPGPTPNSPVSSVGPGSAPPFDGGIGPNPEFYPFMPGLGDSGFGGSDDSYLGDGYATFNGNGFNTSISVGSSDPETPAAPPPVMEPPAVPDPPDPPDPGPAPPPIPPPAPPGPPPPPPGDDDDDDDDDE